MSIFSDSIFWQWTLLIVFGVLFIILSPLSKSAAEFFVAKQKGGKEPGLFMLTSSLVISWIFAKSITNAANLGLSFGVVGGLAYATYYLSFIVAGVVIYQLRVKGGFSSIHHFLESKFGKSAVIIFSILIAFRLFNEVWSNTMVIGSYFGESGTQPYYMSIIVFTTLTLMYVLKGGMRSSLLTDAIQMVFFGVLLFIIFQFIISNYDYTLTDYINTGDWKMSTGMNLLFVALLQIFSYPFHDPILTDRGFLSSPKLTLKSFLYASVIGFVCIFIFSFVGVFANLQGLEGQAAVEVGKLLGFVTMLAMNFIMITSAASTLDSTFVSFSKLIVVDLRQSQILSIKKGRLAMIFITILGTIPVFLSPEILSATTISGTMVMGLAPVFLLWNFKSSRFSFHISIGFGAFIGIIFALGYFPKSLILTEGKYAALLWANFWGLLGCFALYFLSVKLLYEKKQSTLN